MSFMKYLKNSFKLFFNSFKLDLRFVYSMIMDGLFYLFLFFAGGFLYNNLLDKVAQLSEIGAGTMTIEQIGTVARLVMMKYYLTVFLAVIFFMLIYSLFRSLMWSFSLGSKPNKKYMKNFTILSCLWILFWMVIIYLFNGVISSESGGWLLLFGFLFINYLTKILFILFIKNRAEIKMSYEKMIDIAFKRFYLFIVPYIFEFIIFMILFIILFNLKFIALKPLFILIFFVFLAYSAWARKYFSSVVKQIK